jgi:APA family basic amino acid/polyamine antiporter
MATQRPRSLTQAIGRLALTGLVLNAVIGSSVFGLPSVVAGELGAASPLAWLLAALGMALIVACYAEVASRFSEAGGQYLYARAAFGRLAGIEMAWLTYLVRLTAAATNANLFVISLAQFWPGATGPLQSRMVLGAILLPLAIVNYRGVGSGLTVSNAFTIAKLVPLGVFVVAGLGVLVSRGLPGAMHPSGAVGLGGWLQSRRRPELSWGPAGRC